MGFCLINNIAVAAAAIAAEGERVVVLDWDVHHGNGTQAIFWDDPMVLYASIHEWPAYPGTGRATETGGFTAAGLTVNVPLCAGATGDVALAAVDEVLVPAVEAFRPDWVLVSAGYDAHRDDPLADLAWSAGDFADLTRRAMDLAPCPGRVVAILEGGYDLRALARSAGATVATLGGVTYRPEAATSGGPGREVVAATARARSRLLGGLP
jgi:acetoin utilization deacetylase AcuC-like enzyme